MVVTSVSVILCTHNPRADYLRRTLDALRAQTLLLEKWELLLIDNASKERLAEAWDISWHTRGRHVREDEMGLTAARLRGIRESKGKLLVFVDDDNVLAPDYLATAEGIICACPFLGVWGAGRLEPEFEVKPSSELVPRLPMLALRTVSTILWSNNTEDYKITPWGAGLCVRRPVAERYQELVRRLNMTVLLDRRGKQLFCGGDDLFSYAAVELGQGFGLFPELQIIHLVSSGRLRQQYFVRLIHDHAFSHGVLKYLLTGSQPAPVDLLRYVRLFLHGVRNGLFSAQCGWAESQGHNRAARFISEHRLRPIKDPLKQPGPVICRNPALTQKDSNSLNR